MTSTHQDHIYLKDLHFEHRLWLNELKFVKDEIDIFTHRLSEVEIKNNGAMKNMLTCYPLSILAISTPPRLSHIVLPNK